MAIDLTTIAAGTGGFVIHGQDAFDQSGWSVASAGDVNGDGFADLIIGVPRADAAGNATLNAGDSYVVFGKAAGWGAAVDLATIAAGTGGFVIQGQGLNDESGRSVASAGDVNGDGFDDLIIGAPAADAAGNAKPGAGDSYVVFGKAAGWGAAVDLATIAAGTGGFVIHGQDSGDWSGSSVASAGDVNGDGFADLIIGARFADAAGNARNYAGDSYVVFGKAAGWGAAVDLAGIAAGTGGFVIHGQEAGDRSGFSVASAGDVNGDGFDDLIIGAPVGSAAGNAKSYAGDSYVVFGRAAGWGAALDLATIAAGTGGFVIHGQDAGDRSGFSVASAGDVNGDGFADLIIGGSGGSAAGNAKSLAGDSYVVFGKAAGWGAPIDLADVAAGTGGFVIHGQDAGDSSGYSVASAGDVNGDGFDDLIIGARYGDAAGNAKSSAGDSYVVFGKASGWGAPIDLADVAAGAGGFVIHGQDGEDASGFSVASAGDVDGDGFDDLIIGASLGDAAGNAKANAGDTYVIFGRDFTATVTHAGTAAAEALTGTANADVIVAGQGNDTLLGQGGADALKGGAGNDRIVVTDLTFQRVDGGSGTDTLVLAGTGLTLDLAAIPDTKLQGIEVIELGGNTLRVTALAVLNLSDTSNTLRVAVSGGHTLAFDDAGWVEGATAGGITTWTNGQASLVLQQIALPIDLASIAAGTGGFVIHGQDADDRSGFSVASAGDVNGDGFDDLIIGARYAGAAGNAKGFAGDSYVVFGKAAGWGAAIDLANVAAGIGGFVIHGEDAGDVSGFSVASAGDVNGDGFADLIIGARYADAAGNAKGFAGDSYVVFGRAAGWGAATDLADVAAGADGFVIHGQDALDQSGWSVASAGDVNGDGFDDLIIGAPLGDAAANARNYAGESYVVFGKAAGWGAAVDLATIAAGTGGFVIHGQDAGDQSGYSVASAGDVNGDGFDDLIIGAPFARAAGNAKIVAGDSYVVFGKAAGWGAAIDLADVAAGTGGFVIHGRDAIDLSGLSVASAGDVNGDGFADLIIGARGGDAAGNAKSYAGESYVVFGKAAGWGAAIDLADVAAGTGGFVIHGQDADDQSGRSVASAGDVNGDGFDDLIIGAYGGDAAGNAKSNAGESYVVFGKAVGWGAAIDLTTIAAGTGGFVIHGQDANDRSGFSVASAGDLDGDGFDDLIIGASLGDAAGNAKSLAGDSYVVFGRDFTATVTHAGTAAAEALTGTANADVIVAGQGNDTLLGQGGADALKGGAGNDRIVVTDLTFQRVDGGSGTDTLVLAGTGLTLDLAAIPDTKLQGIEVIELGSNTLRVTALEVLNLSDTSNTLRVTVSGGHTLAFDDAGWVEGATAGGITTWTNGQASLVLQRLALPIDLATIAAGNGGFVIHGQDANDSSGFSVASAGDVNGDGFDDLIIGAFTADAAGNAKGFAGDSYVVFGRAAGWGAAIDLADVAAGADGFVIHGQDALDQSGWSVASAGDVNGDGFDDLIIGAPLGSAAGNAKPGAGESYVVFGKAAGWGSAVDLATIAAGTGGFVIHGQDAFDQSGYSVAAAGDVNGDGFADLIIGARVADAAGNAKLGAGESYVVFGKAAGWGAAVDLATIAAGTGGFVIHGQDAGDVSGYSVAAAGDVNGDGFADLIIGAYQGDAAGNAKGTAGDSYVVFGKAAGWGAAIDLGDVAAGTGGFVIHGQDVGDFAGYSVASAGDVNGDGFADLIVGARGGDAAGNAKSSAGESYVVFGKAAGWGAPVDLATIAAGTGGFVIHGQDADDQSGRSVASAGDVNGDGFDDLIIGAFTADAAGNAKSSAGDSYVVFGKASGWGAPIDLADVAAGAGGFVIHGQDALDQSGRSVASAGDVDGDGFDDLVIGAFTADAAGNAKSNAGDTYVIFGRDFNAATVTHAGTAAAETLTGTANADVIVAGQGNDTLLGQGGSDALKGGAGNDRIVVTDLTFQRVDGGSGTDTLVLAGSGLTLDLAAIPDTKLQGIEVIEIGTNTLRVTALEVLNLADSTNTLRVTGGAGYTLVFDDAGWVEGASAGGFTTYTNGQATLLAQDSGPGATAGADTLAGTAADDVIDALAGNDSVSGQAGNDTLQGGADADTLDGGTGADSLSGGAGNDLFILDEVGDLLVDSGGADTVQAAISFALASGFEALVLVGAALNGTGNGQNNLILGNALGNLLNGVSGNDTLDGKDGPDTLQGALGADSLVGGEGADSLNGTGGADTMVGGAGNDAFVVDDVLDVIQDSSGVDTVFTPFATTLAAFLENLTLTGGDSVSGTGNGSANIITGNNAANNLAGGGGNDSLRGENGNDTLTGGTGADTMAGGIGADRYSVDSVLDQLIEQPGEGTDIVIATVSWTLADAFENLQLIGAAALNGIGTTLVNRIAGNDGANRLEGLDGNDVLIGGAGADTLVGGAGRDAVTGGTGADWFLFEAPTQGSDAIKDFAVGVDEIAILASAFSALLPTGALPAANFVSHAANTATSAFGTPQFVYNSTTGVLFFDANGLGGAAVLRLAVLLGAPTIGAGDFLLV